MLRQVAVVALTTALLVGTAQARPTPASPCGTPRWGDDPVYRSESKTGRHAFDQLPNFYRAVAASASAGELVQVAKEWGDFPLQFERRDETGRVTNRLIIFGAYRRTNRANLGLADGPLYLDVYQILPFPAPPRAGRNQRGLVGDRQLSDADRFRVPVMANPVDRW